MLPPLKEHLLISKMGERLTSMGWKMLRSTGLVAITLLLQAISWAAGKVFFFTYLYYPGTELVLNRFQ